MSTFDRWNKLAGLQNESAEPQQLAESKQQPESSKQMNESQLREMISKIAKEILSEARATNYQVGLIQSALQSVSDGSSEIKDKKITDQFRNIRPDGKFGPKTKMQVRIFQDLANLKDDGVVGPNTLRALISVLDNAGAKGLAIVDGLQGMVDQGVVAKQGHGFDGKKSSKQAAPKPAAPKAPGKEDIEVPTMNVAVDDSEEDDFLSDEFLASLPEDPSFEDIAAAKGEEVAADLVGEPVPGDEPTDLDVTLPGMPNTFIRGVQFTDVYGDKTLSISQEDYERAGSPDLDDIARANRVDKVDVSA